MDDTARNLTVAGGKCITELKVTELKAELENRGQNKYGNKKELVERLRGVSICAFVCVLAQYILDMQQHCNVLLQYNA